MIGPLVVPGAGVRQLAERVAAIGVAPGVSLTFPSGVEEVGRVFAQLPEGIDVVALEVAVPTGEPAAGLVDRIREAAGGRELDVIVEVPRDERCDAVLVDVAGAGARVKFRTGGIRPDLYPTEAELATGVQAAHDAGVTFKATAGLHHAVRNTDPVTGFEQHGFVNLLLAAHAVVQGATHTEVVALLAERSGADLAQQVRELGVDGIHLARGLFTSFGCCSVAEPLTELHEMGLLAAAPHLSEASS